MDISTYLLPLMFILLFTGLPIVFAIGLAVVLAIVLWQGVPLVLVFQQFYQGIDSFTLLAIPLFMICGEIMGRTGITQDILKFCDLFVGRLRARLGYVNILANVLFAAISGSASADMAAIAPILTPDMEKQGYSKEFSLALSAAAAVIGPIIPPSILMVIYSSSQGTSIGAMFVAGVIPGILIAVALMIYVTIKARQFGVKPSEFRYTPKEKLHYSARAIPALLTPVIILGGIFSGMFSPTEAAGFVCVYAALVGMFYYRTLSLKGLVQCATKGMLDAAPILLICAVSKPFSWLVAMADLPTAMGNLVTSITDNKFLVLLLLNILLLILGCLIESAPNVLIFAPIFAPLAVSVGVDPLHFGLIMVLNLVMGVATPPFGLCLFMGSNIGKIPMERIVKPIIPMIGMEIIVLALVTYIPDLCLFLPRLLGIYAG